MNLKEAFRFQNKLNSLLAEAENVLERDTNVMKVENTYLRKKVMPEAENETVVDTMGASDYAEKINELAAFTLFLLDEKGKLSKAIRVAKNSLAIDIDGETSLNGARQHAAKIFKHMADLRASEITISNGGTGYRFNAEGNQVSYKCDVRRVTSYRDNDSSLPMPQSRWPSGRKRRASAGIKMADVLLDSCRISKNRLMLRQRPKH